MAALLYLWNASFTGIIVEPKDKFWYCGLMLEIGRWKRNKFGCVTCDRGQQKCEYNCQKCVIRAQSCCDRNKYGKSFAVGCQEISCPSKVGRDLKGKRSRGCHVTERESIRCSRGWSSAVTFAWSVSKRCLTVEVVKTWLQRCRLANCVLLCVGYFELVLISVTTRNVNFCMKVVCWIPL